MFESAGFFSMQQQWRAAIEEGTDWVELITWNDWGESTYLAPVGSPADRDIWQDVFPSSWGRLLSHDGFLGASQYYISWFKHGTPPAIERDELFYFYRIHPETLRPRPRTMSLLLDRIFLTSFLSRSVALTVTSGKVQTTVNLPDGTGFASVPLFAGRVGFTAFDEGGNVIGMKTAEELIYRYPDFGIYNYFSGVFVLPRSRNPFAEQLR
jgi:hypothetical protein